jgi:hypothetical protein
MVASGVVDRAAALALAQQLVDYRAKSMVARGRELAQYVLNGGDADGLAVAKARVVELETNRKTLCDLIERLRAAAPDKRDGIIAEACTACAAMQ